MMNDAEIVLHVFFAYLNFSVPTNSMGESFYDRHFARLPTKESSLDGIYIFQDKLLPPDFKVVLRGKSYPVFSGSNNLFQAMAVFVFLVDKEFHGILHKISFGSSTIGLNRILSNSPYMR